jgi:hypothetical protein
VTHWRVAKVQSWEEGALIPKQIVQKVLQCQCANAHGPTTTRLSRWRMRPQLGLTRVTPLGAGCGPSDELPAKNNQSRYHENDY